jgi:hypothetical protein
MPHFWLCPSYIQMRDNMVDRIRADLDIQVTSLNILDMAVHGKIEKAKQQLLLNITTEYIKTTIRFQ